jgi:hypothetical protein
LLYGQILPVPQKADSLDADKFEQAVQTVARANAVPFVGPLAIDSDIKKFLFCLNDKDCHPIPPKCYQWLVVGQNLVSIVLYFSSASRCAIISRSSNGPKRPGFPNAAPASSCSFAICFACGDRAPQRLCPSGAILGDLVPRTAVCELRFFDGVNLAQARQSGTRCMWQPAERILQFGRRGAFGDHREKLGAFGSTRGRRNFPGGNLLG